MQLIIKQRQYLLITQFTTAQVELSAFHIMLNAYFVTHIHLQLNIWFLCLGSSSELIAIVLNYLARRLETWMPSWVLLLHFLYTNKSKPFRTREKQLNVTTKNIPLKLNLIEHEFSVFEVCIHKNGRIWSGWRAKWAKH